MVLIVLLFGFAMSWIAAFIGLYTEDEETSQLASFVLIFPIVFASAAFVPVATMPGWLQAFANNQPVTFVTNAARSLALGVPADGAIWKSIIWIIGILIVFVPLSVWSYRKHS